MFVHEWYDWILLAVSPHCGAVVQAERQVLLCITSAESWDTAVASI